MATFCTELEQGRYRSELPTYQRLLRDIIKWYQDNYGTYAEMLRSESENRYEKINCSLDECVDGLEFAEDLSYHFGAKLSYFSISDTLVKLILSRYSYGPSQDFLDQHGLQSKAVNCSWLKYNCKEIQMVEILAKVLRDNGVSYSFDLQALMRDRKDRNDLAHASQKVACLSAIRCYNSIRNMLIFLDGTCADVLQPFKDGSEDVSENTFDINQFTAAPCNFGFENYTSILIVDSVHDVRSDFRRVVANLPWTLVIDLDGCSESGGLLSSVEHNNIRKECLNLSLVNGFRRSGQKFQVDCTTWYRCGDYQVPSYSPDNSLIPSNNLFCQGCGKGWRSLVKKILGPVLRRAELSERPLNIVVVSDDELLVDNLVDFCQTEELSDYFMTWVGLSVSSDQSITQHWFQRDKEYEEQHFRRFLSPIPCFFEEFYNYSDSWPVRSSLDSSFSLPGPNKELVVIAENIRNKLSNYFEPLYDNCETFCTDVDCSKEVFDSSGAPVAWSLIESQYAVPLKEGKKVERTLNSIRTLLGTKQDDHPQKRLFFLCHQPGIGGTTFARQLAWKLHRDHAVLVVKHYEPGEITNLVQNLYDNILGKNGVVLLADETLSRLKDLCNEVCRIDRRCILIVSCRLSSGIPQAYPDAAREELKILDNTCIRQLKEHFRLASRLDKPVVENRYNCFEQSVTSEMRSPFIIGLYFMDEDFNIDGYVNRALDSLTRNYADALAYIALGDRYNHKNLPKSLINGLLGLRLQDDLAHDPHANSIVFSNRDDDNIPCYSFKHYLLARRYLELYNQRYYPNPDGDLKNMLYQLTMSLISNVAFMAEKRTLKESYLDFLSYILIQNKDDFDHRLSALMSDISRSDSQIMLLKQLADLFQPYADAAREKEEGEVSSLDWTLRRVVSHANAHLGRIYWKEQKYADEALRRCELAKVYMPDEDPDIYHMTGSVQKDKLAEQYKDLRSKYEQENVMVTVAKFQELEQQLWEADQNFDSSCRYGSPEYGYPSKLQLYNQYLEFVYAVKGIHKKEDFSLLSNGQQEIRLSFIRTLEEIDTLDTLGQEADSSIETSKSRFEGNILFNDPGAIIQFYQNLVDKYKQDQTKIYELATAQRGLVFARINAVRAKNNGTISFRDIPDPVQLQENIYQLLIQPYSTIDYRVYSLKSVLYHYWMQLAKVTNTSLESALEIALQWTELEESTHPNFGLDPKPYYYLRSIYFLLYHGGAKNRIYDAKKTDSQIQNLLEIKRFDSKRGSPEKIRDLLVVGKDMGQLLDVSSCTSDAERMKLLAQAKKDPVIWDAKLDEVIGRRSANLLIFSPNTWTNERAFLKIGNRTSNTLSDEQITHTIRFIAGYSVERLVAISDSAQDISVGEPFDAAAIVKNISGVAYSPAVNSGSSKKIVPDSRPNKAQPATGTVLEGSIVNARITSPEKKSGRKISFDAEFMKEDQTFCAEIVDVSPPQSKKLKASQKSIKARIIKYDPVRQVYTLKVL